MKCPRCSREITDHEPRCTGCGFSITDLDSQVTTPPQRQGLVNDFAEVIEPKWRETISKTLEKFRTDTAPHSPGSEIVIITLKTTVPLTPQQYVFWLFNHWNVGDYKANENRGILLLLAVQERRIESEVGYGLEAFVSDALTGEILDTVVVPLLKEGRIGEGLDRGVTVLADIVLEGLQKTSKSTAKGT